MMLCIKLEMRMACGSGALNSTVIPVNQTELLEACPICLRNESLSSIFSAFKEQLDVDVNCASGHVAIALPH